MKVEDRCLFRTVPLSDMTGRTIYIDGALWTITKSRCVGLEPDAPGCGSLVNKYVHRILEVEPAQEDE